MYVSRTTGHLSAWRLVWELSRVASRIKIGVARRYQRHASVVKCTVVRYVVAFSSLRPRVGPHAAFGLLRHDCYSYSVFRYPALEWK
jgi:hypothetical protein